jgi:hypothetical protein
MKAVEAGKRTDMKQILAGALALAFLTTAGPVLAQNRDDHGHDQGQMQGHMQSRHQAPPPRHQASRYHEGQSYRGHRLTNRGGHWGYYQPRNGANIFINIPL